MARPRCWCACRCHVTKCCCLCTCVLFLLVGLAVGGVMYAFYGAFFGPWHASCSVTYRFPNTCPEVQQRIINQMEIFGMNATCGSGSNCYYALVNRTEERIVGTHTTYNQRFIDDFYFQFNDRLVSDETTRPSGPLCHARGFSESRVWYAILDYGTNYCNLYNLLRGSRLVYEEGFMEDTRDTICTQYSSRNCDKY